MVGFVLQTYRFLRALVKVLDEPEGRGLGVLLATQLAAGTVFYRLAEGWAWVDSFYFSVITLTTVGYGDLHPTTTLAKLFTVVYLFTGMGVLISFVGLIGSRSKVIRRATRLAPADEDD